MFRHISKFTASTFKYTTSLFCHHDYAPSSTAVELWLQEIQLGLDAFLDDHIIKAEDIFLQNKASPCHAFGYALILYTKAMLSMEAFKVEEAVHCVSSLETHIKRLLLLVHRKKRKQQHTKIPTSCSVPLDMPFEKHTLPLLLYDPDEYLYMQFELIHANCILMLATLQFLRESWIDHAKAAYDLRKAYKIYERLFEASTGMSILEYQATTTPPPRPAMKPTTRRTVSCDDGKFIHPAAAAAAATSAYHETVPHGAYFGIGLFNMIFSLLPSKVSKLLNTIGFHTHTTSRSTAIHLLRVAYNGTSMYSSLSALVLLIFYTNITMYIQPSINHFFLFKDAKAILQHMQSKYPNGRLWHLIQGKFKRIEGNLTDAVTLFTKAKEPYHSQHEEEEEEEEGLLDSKQIDAHTYFRNASINEFTQFRSFAIYETGWAHIYAGNYTQASEAFFCLESVCNNWSRLFYHYIATCCMIAQGMYEKAALESIQMINMFEQKRKLGHRISSNEHYAESKVASWIAMSTAQCKSLKETLHTITNPIWELAYLWHGTRYWTCKVIADIKSHATGHTTSHDPMLYLILGVLYRDVDKNLQLAMEYFNLILMMKKEAAGWMYPYAMYEIAATQCTPSSSNNTTSNSGSTTLAVVVVTDWVRCIEAYYQQHPQDKEWECRMQLRCQLLLESCCCV